MPLNKGPNQAKLRIIICYLKTIVCKPTYWQIRMNQSCPFVYFWRFFGIVTIYNISKMASSIHKHLVTEESAQATTNWKDKSII